MTQPSSTAQPAEDAENAENARPARLDDSANFLPISPADVEARGWDELDILFVSGDAYVDHPSFAAAILGRWLLHHGFRIALLSQPDWHSADAWRAFGRPRLFYAVSAGNMDSLINHYTANRKRRNSDAYSPGGRIGLRPDRATAVYAQRCREAYKGVPVITGGVEASLRRIAHYDYWSDKVWASNLVHSKADLLAYGMGERTILAIAQRLAAGESVRDLRDLRGVAYLLGKAESLSAGSFRADEGGQSESGESSSAAKLRRNSSSASDVDVRLPSFEEVKRDKRRFADMTRLFHAETNPLNARRMLQSHGERLLVINPPTLPLSEAEMDALHELPYTRRAHSSYDGGIPAWQTIRDSVQIMRGCFGGCTFCSITMHQGRTIQSRSAESVLREVREIASTPGFKGHISDLGGPTANMYRMRCSRPEVEAVCRRLSCIHPKVCKLLDTDHAPTVELMRESRQIPGVKKVHIASGIRMDLARGETEYLDELVQHHVGGHLKVAPEHTSDHVLDVMKKPAQHTFEEFAENFEAASARAGKQQYLVPYFIASHPGSTVEDMIELAVFLKQRGYKPRQVQDFIPAPMDIATCIYYTGLDPSSMKPVATVRRLRDRGVQRAMLQFFMPENYFAVRDALIAAGRRDLIGEGRACLISATPSREALSARREGQHSRPEGARDQPRDQPGDQPRDQPGKKGHRQAGGVGRDGGGYRASARLGSRRRRPEQGESDP